MRDTAVRVIMRMQRDMSREANKSEVQRQSNTDRIDSLERLVSQLTRRVEELELRLPPLP